MYTYLESLFLGWLSETGSQIIIACYGILFYYLFAGFWRSAYTVKKEATTNGSIQHKSNAEKAKMK